MFSVEWCHVTENGFASVTMRRPKKHGGGCPKLWPVYFHCRNNTARVRSLLMEGRAAVLWKLCWKSKAIVCDATGETVDPKIQIDPTSFTKCVFFLNRRNTTMWECTHIRVFLAIDTRPLGGFSLRSFSLCNFQVNEKAPVVVLRFGVQTPNHWLTLLNYCLQLVSVFRVHCSGAVAKFCVRRKWFRSKWK